MDRIEPFLVRLTKGFLRHHFPALDYSGCAFSSRFIPVTEPMLLEALQGTQFAEVGTGTFFYRYRLSDTGLTGFWYLVFYECLGFLVTHHKPGVDPDGFDMP